MRATSPFSTWNSTADPRPIPTLQPSPSSPVMLSMASRIITACETATTTSPAPAPPPLPLEPVVAQQGEPNHTGVRDSHAHLAGVAPADQAKRLEHPGLGVGELLAVGTHRVQT